MRIGTIGTGIIVDDFLKAIQKSGQAICTAIYSRSAESARQLAIQHGVSTIYTTLNALFSDSSVDFIYIASPNSLHYEQAFQALSAGKNVIVEKAFCSTVKEAEALVSLAREKQLYLFEAISTIHLSTYLKMQKKISSLGPIRLVQCNFSQYSSRYDKLLAGEITNVFDPAFSGGALSDINIYNLHAVIGLFGSPSDIHYFANKAANGIDTSGVVVMSYEGFQGVCCGAKDSQSPSFIMVQGENGYVRLDGPIHQCPEGISQIGGTIERFSGRTDVSRLHEEVNAFVSCYSRQDMATCIGWQEHSLAVMRAAVAARQDAGIVFPADLLKQ